MSVFYNENDPKAAAWLSELIMRGQLPLGTIDTRSIEDVRPIDLVGYTQCHFFAGIGGWPLALKLAGVPDSTSLWTGSCPCQPFSTAGKRRGQADERHLWPAWEWLIRQCRPAVVFGEQVASPAGREWLDIVQTDMEAAGYACGQADLCAAGVGAPHIRQRLYWVAKSSSERREGIGLHVRERGPQPAELEARGRRKDGSVGDASGARGRGHAGTIPQAERGVAGRVRDIFDESRVAGIDRSCLAYAERDAAESRRAAEQSGEGARATSAGTHAESGRRSVPSGVADADGAGSQGRSERGNGAGERAARPTSVDSPWADVDWVRCNDPNGERWRPVKSGTQPLVTRISDSVVPSGDPSVAYALDTAEALVMRLRGYGNAICPPLAAEFIKAALL